MGKRPYRDRTVTKQLNEIRRMKECLRQAIYADAHDGAPSEGEITRWVKLMPLLLKMTEAEQEVLKAEAEQREKLAERDRQLPPQEGSDDYIREEEWLMLADALRARYSQNSRNAGATETTDV